MPDHPVPISLEELAHAMRASGTNLFPVLQPNGVYEAVSAAAVLAMQTAENTNMDDYAQPRVQVVDESDPVHAHLLNDAITEDYIFLISDAHGMTGWTTAHEALAYMAPWLLPKVSEFMTTSRHVCISPREKIYSVHKELFDKQLRVAIALDDNDQLSGVLTDIDISALIEQGCDIWNTELGAKVKPPVTATENTLLKDAFSTCLAAGCSILVVTDGTTPTGTITMAEMTKSIANDTLYPALAPRHPPSLPRSPFHEAMFLDTVLSNSFRTGIVGTDEYLKIIYFNEAMSDFLAGPDSLTLGGDIRVLPEYCEISMNEFSTALDKARNAGEQVITSWKKTADSQRCIQCRLRTVERNDHLAGFVFSIQDITSQHNAENAIRKLAYQDRLTQLPNRLLFEERLSMEIKRARRNKGTFSIMIMDLDGFKQVNDKHGHSTGDGLLREVGRRLQSSVRESDTVARYGGDEFTFILPDTSQEADLFNLSDKIKAILATPMIIDGTEFEVKCSIGFSVYPDDADDFKQLIDAADTRMYFNKKNGSR